MVVKSKFQVWYHHIRDTLAPTLESRNKVLHMIRSTKEPPLSNNAEKNQKTAAQSRRSHRDIKNQMVMPSGANHPQHAIPTKGGMVKHHTFKCG